MARSKKNQKERPKSNYWGTWITIAITGISIVGFSCIIGSSVLLLMGKIELATHTSILEGSFLSSGLTVISCAIAVWAGLNIITTISRRDVEQAKQILSEAEELREIQESQQSDYDRNLFIAELLKTSRDLPTQRFAEELAQNNLHIEVEDSNGSPYGKLLQMEQLFAQVYSLHENDGLEKGRWDKALRETADKGIRVANELLEIVAGPEQVIKFLVFRIGDFNFYKAYHPEKGENAAVMFLEALKYYQKSRGFLEAEWPEYNEDEFRFPDWTVQPFDVKDPALSAYMCNTWGEAYSKIAEALKDTKKDAQKGTQKEELPEGAEDAKNKCLFYCAYAVELDNQREIYARNYGCAIEHARDDFLTNKDIFEKTRAAYQSSLDIAFKSDEGIARKPFQVCLSLNHKYVCSKLQLVKKRDEYGTYSELPDLDTLDFADDLGDLLDYAEKSEIYADLAVEKYPDSMQFFKLRSFIYRDITIFNIKKPDISQAVKYYDKLGENVRVLETLYPGVGTRDPYTRELICHYDQLGKYIPPNKGSSTIWVTITEENSDDPDLEAKD